MFRTGRSRAPVSLLTSLLLGLGLAGATQASAFAAAPAAAPAQASAQTATAAADDAATSPAPAVRPLCSQPDSPELARCLALKVSPPKTKQFGVLARAEAPRGLSPADLASAYHLPTDGGGGATIAIVDAYDDPNAESDLAVYREQYGLPPLSPGQFTKVNQRGKQSDYPPADSSWSGEISLDLDMVSAIAPKANIVLVEADAPEPEDLGASVNTAVSLGATYVSNSYGTNYMVRAESSQDLQDAEQYYDHPGVAVVASSGDNGAGVGFPASAPTVTSVGGTSLVRNPSSPRGWSETLWTNEYGGPGSGCSTLQPKPAFQKDTGCAKRSVTDVSAVADPLTGVAVYDTYGEDGTGWGQYGGTSAASPIIAATYALGGPLPAGSRPNSYPYDDRADLNDVSTGGTNGTCDPAYLCTAGAGYDGPTGLGTPDGVAAFTGGPHGELSGTITDSSGAPVAGAKVSLGGGTTVTDAKGDYDLTARPGTYTLKVTAFDYVSQSITGVTVTENGTATRSATLEKAPSTTLSGTVTDASGHGWPLSASLKLSANGEDVGVSVHTDPVTGHYSLSVPLDTTYGLDVTADNTGYTEQQQAVAVASAPTVQNLGLTADVLATDVAAGYTQHQTGSTEAFDAASAPDGWKVQNNGSGPSWVFGSDGCAGLGAVPTISGGCYRVTASETDEVDTTVTSAPVQLSGDGTPFVSFDAYLVGGTGSVDMSSDGGATWTSVWKEAGFLASRQTVRLPVTGAASVLLRFHYKTARNPFGDLSHFTIDNVHIGESSLSPDPGGLVVGNVTDANTGDPIDGAAISLSGDSAPRAMSGPVPGMQNGDGFYSLFAPTGRTTVTAAKRLYTDTGVAVRAVADRVTRADVKERSGRLKVTGSAAATVDWNGSSTRTITVTNTGTAPATTTIGELPRPTSGAEGTWAAIPDLPEPLVNNIAASVDGVLYAGLGENGSASAGASLYAYDASTGVWATKASAPNPAAAPVSGVINGKIYVNGGLNEKTFTVNAPTEVYDPATDSWSEAASNPQAVMAAASAVLDGKLYSVGGQNLSDSGASARVSVYDPAKDAWKQLHDYPEPILGASCGGIDGTVYCAGGVSNAKEVRDAFAYSPRTDTWKRIAGLPATADYAAYSVANGDLLISGGNTSAADGVSDLAPTAHGWAYNPVQNWWTALPDLPAPRWLAAGAPGFYQVGGATGGESPRADAAVLPGFSAPDADSVPWLSENRTTLTLAPGASAKVRVKLSARAAHLAQPGTEKAALRFESDTPYDVDAVPVTMTVKAPDTWREITGTVDVRSGHGAAKPLAGATVRISGRSAHYTLVTDKHGSYRQGGELGNGPLTVTVSKKGYRTRTHVIRFGDAHTVTWDVTLSDR